VPTTYDPSTALTTPTDAVAPLARAIEALTRGDYPGVVFRLQEALATLGLDALQVEQNGHATARAILARARRAP
jgi:hypothetical protein